MSMKKFIPPSIFVFLLSGYAGWLSFRFANEGTVVSNIQLQIGKAPFVLDFRDIGQRTKTNEADAYRIRIERSESGYLIKNISKNKNVVLKYPRAKKRFVKRWPLKAWDRIELGPCAIRVDFVEPQSIGLSDENGRSIVFRDNRIEADDREFVFQEAYSAKWKIRRQIRWLAATMFTFFRDDEFYALSIGGAVTCADRWRTPGVEPKSAWIVYRDGEFFLAPGNRHAKVRMRKGGRRMDAFPGYRGENNA